MSEEEKPIFHRVLLKLSGQVFLGEQQFGIDPQVMSSISSDIAEINKLGVQITIVIGGGNFLRGITEQEKGVNRVIADYMGMLATVINSLALQDSLEKLGVITRVLTAIEMHELAEPYIRRRAIRHLEKGRVVIFAGGTGNPFFSTDTAAALRAAEMSVDLIMKATKVDGIYDCDPEKNEDAQLINELTHFDVLQKGLKAMDATAVSLCMDNDIPIVVFNMTSKGNIKRIIMGEKIGTLVREKRS
ncbi:MAG: UMP kinase [Candidatus Schekmanbacteria bacterium RBG_13_48_7]|uniref:Uridylate kinase n=1 Tax=Candidatus Schekmanbacteria bacterium RBG_13_48_7 TaxID=1817878 RepID=A0A1F7RT75_9BACT|nr:MAG: UMP kinase [Candidatus Schekmanbacteria bacterium RBG_13_48_7]